METTPVTRRRSMARATLMQAALRSAPLHPPPTSSLQAASSADLGSGGGNGVAPRLIAFSEGLDLAILCASNVIRVVNLSKLPEDNGSIDDGGGSNRRGQEAAANQDDSFHTVSFAADCAPRPGDDTIPSDSIPAKTSVNGLEFSPSGHSLLIWGESYVAVARLPRSSTRSSGGTTPTPQKNGATPSSCTPARGTPRAEGGRRAADQGARWKWTLVDMSGYAVDVMRQRVVQATWHPASDSCVTLLTVGRDEGGAAGGPGGVAARALVMLHVPGRERPELVVPIPDGPSLSPPVAIAHGCGPGWQRFALWIARRNGSVAALCPIVPENAKVDSEEVLELWSVTCDTLVAARHERRSSSSRDNQGALEEEIARLEQQQAWLRETFCDVIDGQTVEQDHDHDDTASTTDTTAATPDRRRSRRGEGGAMVEGSATPRRNVVLQDGIVPRRDATGSSGSSGGGGAGRGDKDTREDAGAACGLVVLAGGAGGGGVEEAVVGAAAVAAAPPPVVLAVAFRAGCVDIAMVPAGVAPRWSEKFGTRISCASAEGARTVGVGAVLESLDLAERLSDKSAKRRQGLSLSAGTGAWTLLAATPSRVTSITVTWASRMEKAAEHARERAARSRPESGGRLDGDLRALLRERPDSDVSEIIFVPPSSTLGRIVGAIPVANPVVGHLAMARLAGGRVEMVNLAAMTLQATEVASAAKRTRAQETPGRGNILPPFEASLNRAVDALENRRLEEPLVSPVCHLLMSELDEQGVQAFEKEADGLVNGGVDVLEKLHLKTNTRLETLREIFEHQTGLIAGISKDVALLRGVRDDATESLEKIREVADEQRSRSASVLAVVQATRPDVSPAERAFMLEMKEMENYADRQLVMMEPATKQVEELRMAEREAEDFLVREAQGVGSGGAGTGLSDRETRDMWTMLQADRERILALSRRLETARGRLAELGVHQDE